jgi:hypothetical protein
MVTTYMPPCQSVCCQLEQARALTPSLPGIPTSQTIMLSVPSSFFCGRA